MDRTPNANLPRLRAEELLQTVEEFCIQNQRMPKTNSADLAEKSLAKRLSVARSSNRLTGKQQEHIESLLNQYGSKRRISTLSSMTPAELLEAVEEFFEREGRMPSTRACNYYEASLGGRLARMKHVKRFTEEQLCRIEELRKSCPNYKEQALPRFKAEELLCAVEEFFMTYGRLPRHYSKDPVERCLYNRFYLARRNGRFAGEQAERVELLMKNSGTCRTDEEKLDELIAFCETHEKWPRLNSPNPDERRLAGLGARKAFRKKLNETQLKRLEDTESKYKRRHADANEAYELLTAFVHETGSWPRSTSEDPKERWLYRQYQSKTHHGKFSAEQTSALKKLRTKLFLRQSNA